jgi:hypothetical protein
VVFPGRICNTQFPTAGKPLKETDPVGEAQFGCKIAPTIGVAGLIGGFTKTVFELAEVQPVDKEVTVKVYEFTGKPENEVVVPTPFNVDVETGLFPVAVMVQPPVLGKFEIATAPVAKIQVGCVT